MVDFVRETPLTVKDVCVLLKVCPLTVRRWMKQGLEWSKFGGRVYTSREALQRFQRPGEFTAAPVFDRDAATTIKAIRERFGIKLERYTDGHATQGTAK